VVTGQHVFQEWRAAVRLGPGSFMPGYGNTAPVGAGGFRMFWPKLLSWMKKLLMSTSFWGIFLLIVVWLVRHFALPWLSPPPPARLQKARPADPAALLSGPAAFTLLALVIAFGVYLRQVSNGAMDALTKIDAGKEEIYPPKKRHTELKINSLRSTNAKLHTVAPFMVLLAMVIVLRIMFDAVVRFPNPPEWALRVLSVWLPLVDLVITIWVCLLFAVIGLVHHLFAARRSDRSQENRGVSPCNQRSRFGQSASVRSAGSLAFAEHIHPVTLPAVVQQLSYDSNRTTDLLSHKGMPGCSCPSQEAP